MGSFMNEQVFFGFDGTIADSEPGSFIQKNGGGLLPH